MRRYGWEYWDGYGGDYRARGRYDRGYTHGMGMTGLYNTIEEGPPRGRYDRGYAHRGYEGELFGYGREAPSERPARIAWRGGAGYDRGFARRSYRPTVGFMDRGYDRFYRRDRFATPRVGIRQLAYDDYLR